MTEFNLSEKIKVSNEGNTLLLVRPVKEFIRRLRDNNFKGVKNPVGCSCCKAWREQIDKLAGEKLR